MFGTLTITNGILDEQITKIGYLTINHKGLILDMYWVEDEGIQVYTNGLYYNLRHIIGISAYNLVIQQMDMMDGITNLEKTEMEIIKQVNSIENLKPNLV